MLRPLFERWNSRNMSTREHAEQEMEESERVSGEKESKGSGLTPVTARGEATRRKILDAAEEVFGQMGYYEASISEITRRAGVAQGTFYIYFHSKREIFAELIKDIGKRLRTVMREATVSAEGRLEVERRGFEAFFLFVARHRRIYSIVQEAERVAPEAFYDYYQRIGRSYARGLTEAMGVGSIREVNAEAIAYALMGIGHFVAMRWLTWPQENDATYTGTGQLPESVFESVLEFIAYGLAVERPGGK